MLFNLSCSLNFPTKRTGYEIHCQTDRGPSFNLHELAASHEPMNGKYACAALSNSNKNTYDIPVVDG
jgi:hypothetical protein